MEDRHCAVAGVGGVASASLFGVFDGHGGAAAAAFAAARLAGALGAEPAFPAQPEAALEHAFEACDASFLRAARGARPPLDDGTTAVAALVLWGKKLYVANAGDSRALLVHRNGRAEALSDDHKPNRPDEAARIRALGGAVVFHGVWRVAGVLAVSRALGDRSLKPFVVARPDVRAWTLGPNDRFLVLATDGIFDVLGNREVGELVCAAAGAQAAADALVEQALFRGSTDNCTALIVDLSAPNPAAAAAAASGAGAMPTPPPPPPPPPPQRSASPPLPLFSAAPPSPRSPAAAAPASSAATPPPPLLRALPTADAAASTAAASVATAALLALVAASPPAAAPHEDEQPLLLPAGVSPARLF
jgi:protein phosphatase 1L